MVCCSVTHTFPLTHSRSWHREQSRSSNSDSRRRRESTLGAGRHHGSFEPADFRLRMANLRASFKGANSYSGSRLRAWRVYRLLSLGFALSGASGADLLHFPPKLAKVVRLPILVQRSGSSPHRHAMSAWCCSHNAIVAVSLSSLTTPCSAH